MSKKRMFDTRFWSDGFIVDELNPLDRLLYLYLLLNEHTNLIGIYELSSRTAAFETGIDRDGLEKMMIRLSPKIEYIDGWVYIRRFADYQQNNPNIATGMMREVTSLPESLRKKIIENGIVSERLAKAFNTFQNPSEASTADKPLKAFESVGDTRLDYTRLDSTKPLLAHSAASAAKPATPKVASKDIDLIFDYWKEKVGYAVTSQLKSNREHCAKLIREYSVEDVRRMIDGVAMSHGDQYAPRISNFIQLYRKWDDLKAWGRRGMSTKNSGKGVVI